MLSDTERGQVGAAWRAWFGLLLVAITAFFGAMQRAEAAAPVVIWDTGTRFGETLQLENRAAWKAVPSDLIFLESDPTKASSDPGYYGREYPFQGDAVVENQSLAAVFWSALGRVSVYAKNTTAGPGGTPPLETGFGHKIADFVPLQAKLQPSRTARYELVRHAGDEVVLQVAFDAGGTQVMTAVFSFGKTGIIEIRPAENMKGVRLLTRSKYGVVPGFLGDDLIYNPADYAAGSTLHTPAQSLFMSLLEGENSELVMTWPAGNQRLRLNVGQDSNGEKLFDSLDFDNDGQSLFLAPLAASGIWHREALLPAFLEKDTPIQWKAPFPAKWTTQLNESGVRTTYAFRLAKGEIWRGVPGSYAYPVWFDGDTAFYHLSKKVPPGGDSIVYFLEGRETPLAIRTPVEILKDTLGRPMADGLLDVAGRKLRTHHRRDGEGVRRACTCGCTEAIQAVFEAKAEVEKSQIVAGQVEDMMYFVQRHLDRIDEYQRFVADLNDYLLAQGKAHPELKPFLEGLSQIAAQIPQECEVQKENMKSLAYARDLSRQTLALVGKQDPGNLKAYLELGKTWRAMGGAQDYVVAQCHMLTRKICQEAGYGCVSQPQAAKLAQEIRARCRRCLRNPDGYEIWADY